MHTEIEYDSPFEVGEAYDIHLDKMHQQSGPVVVPSKYHCLSFIYEM